MEKLKGIIAGKRVGVISLGCDKNRVDTEKMLALLSERHVLVNEIEKAQIIIVNTCAFLNASRKVRVVGRKSMSANCGKTCPKRTRV